MADTDPPAGGFQDDPLLDPSVSPEEKARQVHDIFQSVVATLTEEEAKAVSDRFAQAMTLVARREVLSAMEQLRREILQVLREVPTPETPLVILTDEEENLASPPSGLLDADAMKAMQQRIAGSIREVLYEAAGLGPASSAKSLPDETVRKLAKGLTTTRLRRRRH